MIRNISICLLLASFALFSLACCTKPDSDENGQICRTCYANFPNGDSVEMEACSAEEEQQFMQEYSRGTPICY